MTFVSFHYVQNYRDLRFEIFQLCGTLVYFRLVLDFY